MESLVQRFIYPLDTLRFLGLRWTMRFPLFREAYLNRSNRLFIQHTLALCLSFFSTLLLPSLSLILVPLIYGIPHLLSGARYIPRIIAGKRKFISILPLMGIGYLLLYFIGKSGSFAEFFRFSDGFFLISSFVAMSSILLSFEDLRKLNFWFRCLLVLCCSFLLYKFPIQFSVVMLIGHNLLAYLFWLFSCKTKLEKVSCLLSFLSLVFVGLVLFSGALDLYFGVLEQFFFSKPLLNLKSITSSFLLLHPFDFSTLSQLAIFYAISQSMHYFIWLKAIPELFLSKSCPTSFQESYRILRKDIPQFILVLAAITFVVYLFAHFFYSPRVVRDLYLIGVSYHGMTEIAALFALRRS